MRWLAALLVLLLVPSPLPAVHGLSGGALPSAALRPVPGAVVRAFDAPEHPYGPGHRGVDLAASPGDEVRAALPGTVSFAGDVAGVPWVTVAHGPRLDTTYGGLDPLLVTVGRRVAAGDVLGLVGDGRVHVDWGARLDDGYIDPLLLLRRWRPHLTAGADP